MAARAPDPAGLGDQRIAARAREQEPQFDPPLHIFPQMQKRLVADHSRSARKARVPIRCLSITIATVCRPRPRSRPIAHIPTKKRDSSAELTENHAEQHNGHASTSGRAGEAARRRCKCPDWPLWAGRVACVLSYPRVRRRMDDDLQDQRKPQVRTAAARPKTSTASFPTARPSDPIGLAGEFGFGIRDERSDILRRQRHQTVIIADHQITGGDTRHRRSSTGTLTAP